MINIIETIGQACAYVRAAKQSGDTIAFIPTMGNLHDGHLALIEQGKQLGSRVVVSIFVNPTQFGPNEDFDSYPRTLQEDLSRLNNIGVDMVFTPRTKALYPNSAEYSTSVNACSMKNHLCGLSRPTHFDGVVTVVSKLFNIIQPDVALFGEKDLQQLKIIQRMAAELFFNVQIVGCATVRSPDGLAHSSRNRYLDKDARIIAPKLYQSLERAKHNLLARAHAVQETKDWLSQHIQHYGFAVDYCEILNSHNLTPAKDTDNDIAICVAAFLGRTRLIDNIQFSR